MCDVVGEGDRDFILGGIGPLPRIDLIDRVGDGDLALSGGVAGAFRCKGLPCMLAYFDLRLATRTPAGRFQSVWDPKPLAGEEDAIIVCFDSFCAFFLCGCFSLTRDCYCRR